MGPHDLLCKWCSTFVGKGKKFCSIFCESRYTRSKRRKLAFKRPVYSSGPRDEKEYVSPRTNRTAPAIKQSFLEDVITAIENNKPSPERDKNRPNGTDDTSSPSSGRLNQTTGSQLEETLSAIVPKLDLSGGDSSNKGKTKTDEGENSTREKVYKVDKNGEEKDQLKESSEKKSREKLSSAIDKNDRSKTKVLMVHNQDSKIAVKNKPSIHHRSVDLNKTEPIVKSNLLTDSLDSDKKDENSSMEAINGNKSGKTKIVDIKDAVSAINAQAAQRVRSKTAVEIEKKVRSSGYGNPVNPRLRPLAIKPRSATLATTASKQKREASAKLTKSANLDVHPMSIDNKLPAGAQKKDTRELIPMTIREETRKPEVVNEKSSPETENSSPKSSNRKSGRMDETSRELEQIQEIIREESTHSDLLSQTELQLRLSSIKRKVEVRRRGRDSRSSYGSDLDSSFHDSTNDLTSDKEKLNSSFNMNKPSKTSRSSARSNITRISKQFQSSPPNTSRN